MRRRRHLQSVIHKNNVLMDTAAVTVLESGGGTCLDVFSGAVCSGAIFGDKWLPLKEEITMDV